MKFFASFFTLSAVFLSSCNIANNVSTPPATANSILSLVVTEQYATDNATVNQALSSVTGSAVVATLDSTLEYFITPPPGCIYQSADSPSITVLRPLNVGDLILAGGSLAEPLTLSMNATDDSWGMRLVLAPGDYKFQNSAPTSNISFEVDYSFPGPGSNLRLTSGTASPQPLPTPVIPQSSDADYTVAFDKTLPLKIEFTSPLGTKYVRTVLTDGGTGSQSVIVCYGPPDQPIVVPATMTSFLRSTDDGRLFVDFVNAKVSTAGKNVKEAVSLAYSRHIHGLLDVTASSQQLTLHFGVLRIQ